MERYFGKGTLNNGHVKYHSRDTHGIVLLLEHHLGIPVVNKAGLKGLHHIELDDDQTDLESVNQSLKDQLGLQLTPDTQTIDLLMVEKAK